jgi:hypothetical protein
MSALPPKADITPEAAYLSFQLEPSNGFAVQIPHGIIAKICAVQSVNGHTRGAISPLTAAIAQKKTASINAEEHDLRFFRLHLLAARERETFGD